MVMFLAVLATSRSAADRLASSPLLQHPAPPLAGSALDGRAVDLQALRGKFVLVNFLASWCVPCRQEHPELVKFSQRHQAAGDAAIVGVIFDDTAPNVRRFMADLGGDWPVLADPDGRVALDYGVRGPPESFLVDPDGVVVAKIVGPSSADGLERLVGAVRGARG
jgi:cytochrome c biogenesis protein CcmG/thiol:disulfide interchange protein DsbE